MHTILANRIPCEKLSSGFPWMTKYPLAGFPKHKINQYSWTSSGSRWYNLEKRLHACHTAALIIIISFIDLAETSGSISDQRYLYREIRGITRPVSNSGDP